MRKRILSLCMAVLLCLSMLPVSALADDEAASEEPVVTEETVEAEESAEEEEPAEAEGTIDAEEPLGDDGTSDGVAVDETNFPDATFRSYVSKNCDDDGDGYLSDDEIADVTSIDVGSKGISDLTGIEHFTALTSLDCGYNDLTTLDVSKNTELYYLDCDDNALLTYTGSTSMSETLPDVVRTGYTFGGWYTSEDYTGSAVTTNDASGTTYYAKWLLPAPTLSSVQNTAEGVKVTWGAVTGATSYNVYRKTSGGSWTRVGTTSKTYYTDMTAKSGTTYTYMVRCTQPVFSGYHGSGKTITYKK